MSAEKNASLDHPSYCFIETKNDLELDFESEFQQISKIR